MDSLPEPKALLGRRVVRNRSLSLVTLIFLTSTETGASVCQEPFWVLGLRAEWSKARSLPLRAPAAGTPGPCTWPAGEHWVSEGAVTRAHAAPEPGPGRP